MARVPQLKVRVETGSADSRDLLFDGTFRIGRDETCEVRIVDGLVSRNHVEVKLHGSHWRVSDLKSTNGTYVNGQKIDKLWLFETTKLTLGLNGPTVSLILGEPEKAIEPHRLDTQYANRYLESSYDGQVGERTRFIRQAFKKAQTQQKKRYTIVIAVVVSVCLLVGVYALYQHFELQKQRGLAENIFYSMKSLEMEFAKSGLLTTNSTDARNLQAMKEYREQRRDMERNYDGFLQHIGFYEKGLTEEDRLILRVTRIFGECELTMPPGYTAEVQKYIRRWQTTERYKKAIFGAQSRGYAAQISAYLLAEGLPPQFFYLALQESSFDLFACGPKTRVGYAKGMWQFIPETAMKFGLKLGPLYDLGRPDPADERHDFEKSTKAAVKYLKFIYTTEAQASGLLVMACYNWGEGKVINLVDRMPQNPRDRNFWQLLGNYRSQVPQETYDYVFYIVAAAVIGENPHLFGFNFENPLLSADNRPTH